MCLQPLPRFSGGIQNGLDEEKPIVSRSKSFPGDEDGWFKLITFGWFTPALLSIQSKLSNGQRPKLEEDEGIPPLPLEDSTSDVNRKFEALWSAELANNPEDPSLKRALWRASVRPFLLASSLSAIGSCAQFIGPAFLKLIIPYLLEESPSLRYGLGMTAALLLGGITQSLCARHAAYICSRIGLRARTALMFAVFQKALVIDSTYYQDHPLGQVTNLMSVDCNRISGFIEYMIFILAFPFQIILSLVGLWFLLGCSCLGGVSVILVSVPLATRLAKWMGTFNTKLMKLKDERINCNQEIISNMKIVKFQAWEDCFQERVEDFRKKEVEQLLKYKVAQATVGILANATPMLVSLLSFGLYIIQGQALLAGTALSALGLFNILKGPVQHLPHMLNFAVECNIAVQRIKDYLMAPDYQPPLRLTDGDHRKNNGAARVIELKGATFSYQRMPSKPDKDEDLAVQSQAEEDGYKPLLAKANTGGDKPLQSEGRPLTSYGSFHADVEDPTIDGESKKTFPLRSVAFECSEGDFIAIVGGVGSGKSTLLKALLGEVQRVSGQARVQGDIAYFDQNPFIMSDTLKENILFGKAEESVDEALYQLAVKASCLEHDCKLFPSGDQTEIGEKGTNLSGGQKARVAIARAVYRDADISLLDDCLSAVDAHVGRALFDRCIVDVLLKRKNSTKRRKTVILTTNALQYLSHPMLSRIVVLRDGAVVESGSYADLISREKSQFKWMLDSFKEFNVDTNDGRHDCGKKVFFDEEDSGKITSDQSNQAEARRNSSMQVRASRTRSSSILSTTSSITKEEDCAQIPKDSSEHTKVTRHHPKQSLPARSSTSKKSSIMTDEMEEGQVGKVDSELYALWLKAAGGRWVIIPLIMVFVAPISIDIIATRWITIWGLNGETEENIQLLYLGDLALIYLAGVIVGVAQSIVPVLFGLKASRKFFSALLGTLLAAPMSFYDTTPTGRILNRFSKDVNTLDERLIGYFNGLMKCLFAVFAALFLLLTASPWVAVALPFLCLFYKRQYDYYNQSNRELKRVDSARRSPIYHMFTEALNGYCTIRAFGAEQSLLHRMCETINKQQHATYLMNSGRNWLAVRLEFVGTCLSTIGCFAFVMTKYVDPENGTRFAVVAGMALPYLLNINGALTYLVQLASGLEAEMVSVERIQEYIELEREAPQKIPADNLLEEEWPSKGFVEFKSIDMRYRPGCPLVLKGLDVVIPSKARVGICGRTGAGKSSLMTALMRIAEVDQGQIIVDGINIKKIGLTKLRSNITIIPQDPVLFSGTVQSNIDPFHRHSEDKLMAALGRVGLLGPINSVQDCVEQNGNNFSAGQRQLLVIARALLDNAAIVICDEATASIDAESDARIQKVFRTEFANSTTLTVAHRLNTIMDSTHILVISDGRAVEFDAPSVLLSRDGLFNDLVNTWEKEHH